LPKIGDPGGANGHLVVWMSQQSIEMKRRRRSWRFCPCKMSLRWTICLDTLFLLLNKENDVKNVCIRRLAFPSCESTFWV